MSEPIASARTSDARAERLRRLRPHLASPCCREPLDDRDASLSCRGCGQEFPRAAGVPLLTLDRPREWLEQRDRKLGFARRPTWRRRLLNPDITDKRLQARRLEDFLAPYGPSSIVVDVGSSLVRRTAAIVCFDLIPTDDVDLVGDLHRMPLADGSVDAVVCTGVLEHVDDPDRAVNELRRVLKPGGRIYVSLPFLQGYHPSPRDYRRFTRDGARQLMAPFAIDALVNTRGSGSTVTWILSSFLAQIVSFGLPGAYALARALFGWLLLPIKYLDPWLTRSPFDHYITSGFTVIATKLAEDGAERGAR
jgi:SAM-dependent methyltransferase